MFGGGVTLLIVRAYRSWELWQHNRMLPRQVFITMMRQPWNRNLWYANWKSIPEITIFLRHPHSCLNHIFRQKLSPEPSYWEGNLLTTMHLEYLSEYRETSINFLGYKEASIRGFSREISSGHFPELFSKTKFQPAGQHIYEISFVRNSVWEVFDTKFLSHGLDLQSRIHKRTLPF